MDKLFQILKETKKAQTAVPINELSKNRWSPRAFQDKKIDSQKLMSIFEAARWTGSAFNEQPWRFIVGMNGDQTFDKLFNTLIDFNKTWANNASALILNIYKTHYKHNNKPNNEALYDLGQAVGNYCLEAVNQGLISHQITGFQAEQAQKAFHIDDQFVCFSITAIGYLDNPNNLSEELFKVELQNRYRNTINQMVFTDELNKTAFTL